MNVDVDFRKIPYDRELVLTVLIQFDGGAMIFAGRYCPSCQGFGKRKTHWTSCEAWHG